MRKLLKRTAAGAAVIAVEIAVCIGIAAYNTPDHYRITPGQSLQWNSPVISAKNSYSQEEISTNTTADGAQSYETEIMLFNTIPIKKVRVDVVKETTLIPCGTPFGIKMFTDGVVIVGVADIQTQDGTVNPAAVAGLKVGDIIARIDNQVVNRNEEVAQIIENSGGKALKLRVLREKQPIDVTLQPVQSSLDGSWKGGLWVRDSTAGIGTITFYNPETGAFGGLGHGICDTDTTELMPLLNGEIVPVTISGVTKGQKGSPGELKGYFASNESVGTLSANVEEGVYGNLDTAPAGSTPLKAAMKQEVKAGAAQILTTIDGSGPQYYDIQVESIDYHENQSSKNMVIHVTDSALLEKTGGIVQGMSGSPIIQNGKIVGAVTHVFVNDPTRGYGIFAENMLEVCTQATSQKLSKAS